MACSSISFIKKSYQYDVFLSFSGEDIRRNFVDHLYCALQQQGIHTFKDDKRLKKGRGINDQLLKSIEDSKLFIIVFSKKYASSSWCLNELVKIMECQKTNEQTAYPVFYDVDPSEVRKQCGTVRKAIASFRHSKKKVGKWREALTEAANLVGWDLRKTADGHEATAIKLIVELISLELRSIKLNVDENLIGMENRMKKLESYLEMGLKDIRMIGIKGMGGAGKTTLARAILDRLSSQFEAKSFVENVQQVSKASSSGLLSLQRQILSDVIKDQPISINSVYDGKNLMKRMICGRKVLVVLDDVDHISQLEALAGSLNWFKPGSRIIITTRDEQVLTAHKVELNYNVDLLSDEEAIHLFSRHAFGRDNPLQGYGNLAGQAVKYAAGLPLTIKVLGSFLCGKDKDVWIDALQRLKTIPENETLQTLELSYDGLENDYKEIFLDVACLLKGWEKERAVRLLESCGFHARNGFRVLEQKSLIITLKKHSSEFIDMHDHIEEMGKSIVRRQHPDDPSRHSRLWVQNEIENVLADNTGTEATRCIGLKLTPEIVAKGLGNIRNMTKLRCLVVDYRNYNNDFCNLVNTNEVSGYFPNALRYVYWYYYPHCYLPKTFQANNLVALEMYNSRIEQLWEGEKVLLNLKSLELGYSKLKTLDLELTPHLERLDLHGCYDLQELHVPVGRLKRLVYLNLSICKSLKSLSFIKQLESLIVLNLGRLHLREFPDIIPRHSNNTLQELDLRSNDIEEIPTSIENLRNLVYLKLTSCTKLKSLPVSFCRLQRLKTLYLHGCGIKQLPRDLGQLQCLKKMSSKNTNIKHLPDSICMLKYLKTLLLRGCVLLEKLPDEIGGLESLEELDLSCSNIKDIPSSICKLKHLKVLILEECKWLEKLPEELGNLECLELLDIRDTCTSHLPRGLSLLKGLKIYGFISKD